MVEVLTRTLLTKRITIQGFIMFEDSGEFVAQIIAWFQVGTIKFREDIVDALEKAPQASSACWGKFRQAVGLVHIIDVLHKAFRQELHTATFPG